MTDKIKRGDLMPSWSATLYDDNVPVDLTSATGVRVLATGEDGTLVIDRQASSKNSVGVVTMDWEPGDTDIARTLLFEVEVTWTGARPQTFPVQGKLPTYIYADNG